MYPKQYFDLFRPEISHDTVFVGMSFAPADRDRWDLIIKPAISDAGFRANRVDAGVVSDSIIIEIVRGISTAKLLVFDVTADSNGVRNGNVMYELGLAHASRLPEEVLILRSDRAPLLFDLANVRVHTYEINNPVEARNTIARLLKGIAVGVNSTKMLVVQKLVSLLDEVALGVLSSHASMEYFSLTDASKAFQPETMEARVAIRRLLEFGILSLVWAKDHKKYAYTWTDLGKAVLNHLGFSSPAGVTTQIQPPTQ